MNTFALLRAISVNVTNVGYKNVNFGSNLMVAMENQGHVVTFMRCCTQHQKTQCHVLQSKVKSHASNKKSSCIFVINQIIMDNLDISEL